MSLPLSWYGYTRRFGIRHRRILKEDKVSCGLGLRRLVAGLSPRRPGFDPGSVHVGFVVAKVALGQVFVRVLRFSSVNTSHRCSIIMEKQKKLHLPHRVQGCCASVASAARPSIKKKVVAY
jgi:hypothetical protein